ncbi:MAG: caspase family protein [Cyclobacteriaceae bacterium]|nr:caspase family protein [Cyclobacteriaceae bacterium]
MRSLFILVALFYSVSVCSQGLITRTNEFLINTKTGMPDSGPLPRISWIHPKMEFTNSAQNKIEIKASIDSPTLLKEITLVVSSSLDGRVISKKSFAVKPEQQQYSIALTVNLPDGGNSLSLEAVTESGILVAEKRQIVTGKNASDAMVSLDRKDYILLFATNKYDHWDDLVNPIDDAHAIARELKEKYGFIVDIVENPTVEKMLEKIREYNERKFGPQDQLMVFFAGHGHYDESFGEGFVVGKNSLSNDVSRTTYLSHNRLRGVINNIPCNHILLTMDVCFGGTLDPVLARSRGAKPDEISSDKLLVRKWSHRTRKYLTSGGKEYVSDGTIGKHSPFAGKLIESLRARGGDDGILTLSEIQSNLEKLSQLPRFGSFGDDEALSDFVFVTR